VDQAAADGRLLGWTVIISYFICGPLFIISGIQYGNELKKQKLRLMDAIDEKMETRRDSEGGRNSLNNHNSGPLGIDTRKGENRE